MDAQLAHPDGTQTRGMKGISYDWQELLVPAEPGFTSGLADLIDDEFVTERD
jgi:hypothetical protein